MGTIVNGAAIVLGSLIGLLIRRGVPERMESACMKMLGLSVFIIGMNGVIVSMISVGEDGALHDSGSLLLIASLVIGTVVGEALRLEERLNQGGKKIEQRFGKEGFAKGFINGALIYCVGAMAIVGALNDGLYGDSSTLFVKAMLDGICSVILASTLGYGVLFSAIPVMIYQGSITLFAGALSPFMSGELRGDICMVGYAIVTCIGVNFLEFTNIKTANLLPALVVPILYRTVPPLVTGLLPA